jgi:ABC-type bacteriocin/lantibiotic exporter with double-glycine peptidase domain
VSRVHRLTRRFRFSATAVLFVASAAAGPPLDVPFFRQQKNGCGAASVAMVAQYWSPQTAGGAPSPDLIFQQLYDAEQKGIRLADMKQYLESLRFRAFTLRGQIQDLEEHLAKGRPLIVALKDKPSKRIHFAVLAGIEEKHVWTNDPTRKKPNRIKRKDFEKRWNLAERWMLIATPPAAN